MVLDTKPHPQEKPLSGGPECPLFPVYWITPISANYQIPIMAKCEIVMILALAKITLWGDVF